MNAPGSLKTAPPASDVSKGIVHPRSVLLGKDVIEIVTSAMYASPITIYREYVQNAADAIDAARATSSLSTNGSVTVQIDHSTRTVTVRDDGIGIASKDALALLLAVGGSTKRGTMARGFRGVGRLSGLAYCQHLTFRTKAAGEEQITSVMWDSVGLKALLRDASYKGDLSRAIADVVSVSHEKTTDIAAHFFEVQLSDVARLRNDLLLNEGLITQYLEQVSPLAFSSEFSFAAGIDQHVSKYRTQHPINLAVAGKSLRRPYRDELEFPNTKHKLRIKDVEFVEFADVDGEIGAAGWVAHHEYLRSIPPVLGVRGLRARYGNVQVGGASVFDDAFKEARFNAWSIGELHILDRRIIPNARRDTFETNHHYYNLLVQVGPLATRIMQTCRLASVARNAEQIVRNSIAEIEGRLKQKRSFDRAELSRLKSVIIRGQAKVRRVAPEEVQRQLTLKLERLRVRLEELRPKKKISVVALEEAVALVSKVVTNREQAKRLMAALGRLSG